MTLPLLSEHEVRAADNGTNLILQRGLTFCDLTQAGFSCFLITAQSALLVRSEDQTYLLISFRKLSIARLPFGFGAATGAAGAGG